MMKNDVGKCYYRYWYVQWEWMDKTGNKVLANTKMFVQFDHTSLAHNFVCINSIELPKLHQISYSERINGDLNQNQNPNNSFISVTKEQRAKSAGEVFTLVKFIWTIDDVLRKTILE